MIFGEFVEEDYLRVPEDRIGVIIGKDGETKKLIEKQSKCKIRIDSEGGEVSVECTEAYQLMKAMSVVKAIARGFAPEKALNLLDDAYYFEVISLKELFGKNEKTIQHKKARVIGRDGKIRNAIEEASNCFISVYGHTIAIIGLLENVPIAKDAIEMMLEGANFENVGRFLYKQKKGKEFEL